MSKTVLRLINVFIPSISINSKFSVKMIRAGGRRPLLAEQHSRKIAGLRGIQAEAEAHPSQSASPRVLDPKITLNQN